MVRFYIKNYLKILNMITMNSILYLFVRIFFPYLSPVLRLFFLIFHVCWNWSTACSLFLKLSPSLILLLKRKKLHFSRTLRNILWFLVVYIKVFFFRSDTWHIIANFTDSQSMFLGLGTLNSQHLLFWVPPGFFGRPIKNIPFYLLLLYI